MGLSPFMAFGAVVVAHEVAVTEITRVVGHFYSSFPRCAAVHGHFHGFLRVIAAQGGDVARDVNRFTPAGVIVDVEMKFHTDYNVSIVL